MDGETTKPFKKETAELPRKRGQIKVWMMEELSETVYFLIDMLTGKTEEGDGGKIYNPAGGKTTKPFKKAPAELPPKRGQVKVRVMEELSETVYFLIDMLTGKTEEGDGGKIYNPAGRRAGAAPVRKVKA